MAQTKVISSSTPSYVKGGSGYMCPKTGAAAAEPGQIVSKASMSKTPPHGGSTHMLGYSGSKPAKPK